MNFRSLEGAIAPGGVAADGEGVGDVAATSNGNDLAVGVLKLALDTGAAAAEQLVQQLQPQATRQPGALPLGQVVDLYA